MDRLISGGGFTYVKIPGRQTNAFEDFVSVYAGYAPALAVNYFYPFVQVHTERYDHAQAKYVPIAEMVGKPAVYFRDLVKDLLQYRHVIVYGSTTGRQGVDFNDYASVKKAFNLPD